ncbi:hypothetical protein LCGC14_0525240 [marine sediment metagenome]|uniref:Uncharacterized protein n=1 Tax=marine sediment metagenome TaxID=412755 RepID=A0A0F9RXD7_9ZZZZ
MVGWDSAGWRQITPMLDSGQLPNLQRLVDQGVMGTPLTQGPLIAPIVHNTVATGKRADKHGVLGPSEVRSNGAVQAVNSLSRRAKAFWEIVSQSGRRCNVVSFPATAPAEPVNGVFVSPEFFRNIPASYQSSFVVPFGSVLPANHLGSLKEFVVSLEEIDAETMALFVPRFGQFDAHDPRLVTIAAIVSQTLSIHAVVTRLMEKTDWDVTSVTYPAIEALWMQFLKYHPPRLPWVDMRGFELFSGVAAAAVRLCDLLLGRLLELAGDDAAIVLYSACSFAPPARRPRRRAAQLMPLDSVYRGEGIFVMRAPGVVEGELIHNVHSLDLCPTVLHLCGLAPGDDMDGRVLTEAFSQPPLSIQMAASWDQAPPHRPPADHLAAPASWIEEIGFFAAHADRAATGVRTDREWNLARTFLGSSRERMALPLLLRLYYTHPLHVARALTATHALYVGGQVRQALALAAPIARSFPDQPVGKLMAALIALHSGQTDQAMDLLEQAAEDDPPIPELFYHLGRACLLTDHLPRAIEAFTRSVELAPGFWPGHMGLSEALYRWGQFAPSAEAALQAVGVDFARPAGHVALGRALTELGDCDRAKQAFETALGIDPNHTAAQEALARMQAGDSPSQRKSASTDGGLDEPPPASDAHIQQAQREIAEWQRQFIDDLAAADECLDDYVAENAAAREVTFSPEAGAGEAGAPAKGAPGQTTWIVRPTLPSDQPVLCQMFENPFIDPYNREVLVIHPAGVNDVHGAVVLQLQDPTGNTIKLKLSVRQQTDAPQGDGQEALLLTRLMRAAVARAAAGGAKRMVSTLVEDESQVVLRQCLERLSFETTTVESIYIMDGVTFRDLCMGIVDRYRRRKEIPEDVRLVPLGDVPWQQVDEFLRQWFADGAGAPARQFSPNIPRVMLRGETIVAVFLGYRKSPETFAVTRMGIQREFHGRWVMPWLLGDGTQAGLDDGHTMIEFYTDEARFPEFAKIARRHANAQQTGSLRTMALDFILPWPQKAPRRTSSAEGQGGAQA